MGFTLPRDLDGNLRRLVVALNKIPGVKTLGSCGGHKDPKPYQMPEGQFFIRFDIAKNATGWKAIGILADVLLLHDLPVFFHAESSLSSMQSEYEWTIRNWGPVEPDKVADAIMDTLPKRQVPGVICDKHTPRAYIVLACKNHPDKRWKTSNQVAIRRKYLHYLGDLWEVEERNGEVVAWHRGRYTEMGPPCKCPRSDLYHVCEDAPWPVNIALRAFRERTQPRLEFS